jgi:signal transduction histidine kinase
MGDLFDFLLNTLAQFAGGPGPPENNLVRFGLAAMLWGALLAIAWSRARHTRRDRERLLVIGFGLAFARELYKFGHLSVKMITGTEHDFFCAITAPLEHALTTGSVVLISGAFLRYILDDALLAKRYLILGLSATLLAVAASARWWPQQLLADPAVRFHETTLASLIHLVSSALLAIALVILIRRRGWLRNVVVVALSFLVISELLVFINFATEHLYTGILCPIGNAFYLLAIPTFGYVYFHEQRNEQLRAEAALHSYRDHLEELVKARTAELAKRNAELAAQNAIAATISQAPDLDTVLGAALDRTLELMATEYGSIYLLDQGTKELVLRLQRSAPTAGGEHCARCPARLCEEVSQQAITSMQPVTFEIGEKTPHGQTLCAQAPGVHALVSTPLISQSHAVGAMTLGATHKDAFLPEDWEMLTALGQQIGVAVEKAHLQHQLELTAALEERQRIAAEMHDGLAQTLSYMGLATDRAAALLEEGQTGQVVRLFHQLRDAISQATHEVRRSIASLQERPAPRESLQEAVQRTVAAQAPDTAPAITVIDELPQPVMLPAANLEQTVRVVQEALANAHRHAAAQRLAVRLEGSLTGVTITVEDDGCGFDPQASSGSGEHFGLSIMRARAARIGGDLTIQSKRGTGTRVSLTLPLASWAAQANQAVVSENA